MADKPKREGIPDLPAVAEAAATASAPTGVEGLAPSSVEGLAYKVRLENFFGPLDLLLHLVKESEVDITRIALAQAAEQYVAYITAMQRLDVEMAGEFLSVASQLLLIKARTLVPLEAADEEAPDEEEADASLELIRKLLEFKRFKDRARALDALAEERSRRHGRPPPVLEGETPAEPLRNLELWDLVLLFSRVLKSTRLDVAMSILYRDVPIEVYMDHILNVLARQAGTTFFELMGRERDRVKTVGTLLALLQLARDQKVRISQDAGLGDIRVEPAESQVTDHKSQIEAEPRPDP